MTENLKLWVVTRTYVGVALAKTQNEAEALAEEIQKWESGEDVAEPFNGSNTPPGWSDVCGVYKKVGDMSFGAAKKLVGAA